MASWGINRYDLLAIGTGAHCYDNSWNGAQWSGWIEIVTGPFTFSPTAISREFENYDAFLTNAVDHTIEYAHYDGIKWLTENLGGAALTAAAVTSAKNDSIDVFIIDDDHSIWQNSMIGDAWSGFETLGSPSDSVKFVDEQPATVSCSENHKQVFAIGSDSHLYTKRWTSATGWSSWINIDSTGFDFYSTGPAALCSRSLNTIDVVALGFDSALYIVTSTDAGSTWSARTNLGGDMWVYRPNIISWAPGHLDVFLVGTDSAVYTYKFDANGWHDPQSLLGTVIQPPTAVSWGPNRLDIFVVADDDGVHQRFSSGDGSWLPVDAYNSLAGVAFSRIGGAQ